MITVYTALFGRYETPQEPPFGGVLFTDQDRNWNGWTVKRVKPPHHDARYASRWYFNQSTKALPQATYTIMHGANAQLQMPPGDIVDLLPPDKDIGAFRHAHRRSVWAEAEACIRLRKDDPLVIRRQMKSYRRERFPGDELTTCVILVRRNTPAVERFERDWWREVSNNSCRDQLSFDYVRWKLDFPVHYFGIRRDTIIKVSRHRVHRA